MKNVSYIITNSGTINLVGDGKPDTIDRDHINYNEIIEALKTKAFDDLDNLINITKRIQTAVEQTSTTTNIEIKNGMIYFKDFIVDNTLTRRILELIDKDFPFQPMVKFLENLMENPSAQAIKETYQFMDANNLPITEDGYLLAYRRVTEDWKDFYTRTIDNSIGARPTMDRRMVDDDSDRTCSTGLHFCSLDFLSSYHGGQGRAIIIKINPRDICSIPVCYGDAKGRCCEYEVISEHNPTGKISVDEKTEAFKESLYAADGSPAETIENLYKSLQKDVYGLVGKLQDKSDEDDEADDVDEAWVSAPMHGTKPDGTAFWNVRDTLGRFVKGA